MSAGVCANSACCCETLDLVAAYWKLPSDDIRRKSLTLLRSVSNLKDKTGEPIPDEHWARAQPLRGLAVCSGRAGIRALV